MFYFFTLAFLGASFAIITKNASFCTFHAQSFRSAVLSHWSYGISVFAFPSLQMVGLCLFLHATAK